MSDGSDPSDWWQASDGKWYPPETRPTSAPQPPATGSEPVARPEHREQPPAEHGRDRHAASGMLSYDEHGWIKVDDELPVLPPPAPKEGWRANIGLIVAVVVAVVIVAAAAVVFIPRGTGPHADPSEDVASATTADDGSEDVDPLTLDSVLSNINVRFADVGDGYRKVIDGSIDPLGGDGCAQPRRPFAAVAGTNWTAYTYRPNGFGGIPAGHLASAVTVFDHTADANKRLQQEKGPEYAACLQRWDRQVWFEGSSYKPSQEEMLPLPVKVAGATAMGYRYVATFAAEDGNTYAIFTDHVIFTKGRVRVWVEVSSTLGPFDQARRDLLVSRISKRLDAALA